MTPTLIADSKTLNVLGFSSSILNVFLDLANDSLDISNFHILENMPAVDSEFYIPQEVYKVNFINCYSEDHHIDNDQLFAFGVVGPKSKPTVFDFFDQKFSLKKNIFANLIHPKSYVSKSVSLNYGLQLGVFSSINALSEIGFGVNIKNNCYIGHHTTIGDYVEVNPGAIICGKVEIGKQTIIGAGAVVRNKIKIGSNCIIGMGSDVTKSIPDNSIAYGSPCKVQRINPNAK